MSVTVVSGALQPYAWGRHNALAAFKPSAPAGPHAELWFGTHHAAMSEHVAGDEVEPGATPLLMKILAAATPLSIQVHPDAAGIAYLHSDDETAALLADDGVKDEVLIAVEPFDVLAGLRTREDAASVFAAAGDACPDVVKVLKSAGQIAAIELLLTSPRSADLATLCAALPENEARVMEQVVHIYADDPAVLVSFMLKPRTLQPGEAMYVPAGSIRAYVNGLGVEVMTSSDNVLRLGLTPKQIAVAPALSISKADFAPRIADSITAPFEPAGAPFAVVKVSDSEITIPNGGAVALAYAGTIEDPSSGLMAQTGQAFLVHSAGRSFTVRGTAYIAWPR